MALMTLSIKYRIKKSAVHPQFTHSFLKFHCIIFLHVMFLCNDVFTIYQNIAVDFDTR